MIAAEGLCIILNFTCLAIFIGEKAFRLEWPVFWAHKSSSVASKRLSETHLLLFLCGELFVVKLFVHFNN